jgi:hypothetical protein
MQPLQCERCKKDIEQNEETGFFDMVTVLRSEYVDDSIVFSEEEIMRLCETCWDAMSAI